MRKKGWLILVLFGFLVLDTVYTFLQHHQVALDGDLSSLVLPSPYYEPVLASPFGWEAITGEESYASPNRFFVHWSMYHYFRIGPRWLGALTDTVEGIYLSSAIAKTGAHLLLLVLLSWLAGREGSARDWLWAAVLLAPLFQSAGFYRPVIGLIEPSPTYTFFFAWPSVLMLALLVLVAKHWEQPGTDLSSRVALFIGLIVVLPFTGPIVPGVIMVSLGLFGIGNMAIWVSEGKAAWIERCGSRLPLLYWIGLGVLGLLGFYSLYLGMLSTEQQESVSIGARYLRLPKGLWNMLTNKPALPLLLAGLLWHVFQLRRRQRDGVRQWIKGEVQYLLLFVLLYLLLLPLGGYRDYRPDIVRRDTIQPVLLVLFYLWGRSGVMLVNSLRQRPWPVLPTFALLLLFTLADITAVDEPSCERETMQQLATAGQDTILLDPDCPILTWRQVPNQDTRPPSELLVLWGVLEEGQRFIYKRE